MSARPYPLSWWFAMACVSVAGAVAVVCQPAQADDWTGKDKAGHAQAGALIGGIAAAASQSPTVGCLMAAGAGLAKEIYDTQHPDKHTASVKDFTVTTVAGCLTAKVSGLVFGPGFIWFKKEW